MLGIVWSARPRCPHCLDTGWALFWRLGEWLRLPCACDAGKRKAGKAS